MARARWVNVVERLTIISMIGCVAFASSLVAAEATDGEQSNLEVLDIKFEPIRREKNVVRVKVHNTADQDQTFGIDIRVEVPVGSNSQRQFVDTIKAGETKWTRFDFPILGPVTDAISIRLRFYNPPSVLTSPRELHMDRWFKEERYYGKSLQRTEVAQVRSMPASKRQAKAAIKAFREFQSGVRDRKYEQAWKVMSKNFQGVVAQGDFEQFKARTASEKGTAGMARMLGLRPQSVTKTDEFLVLHATHENAPFVIYFVREDGQWKIYEGGPGGRDWKARLLPTLEKRITEHFDIHYFKDSTAEREVDQIAERKEKGYREICQFLGKDSDVRICMVFFEDGKTKQRETGHQGAGWAFGNTIVEVYNEKEKLDPYHETVHILMGPYGSPPAVFNEGFAVYMSERLGAAPLQNLGGGETSLYERVWELKNRGDWIPLEELLTYKEIGSEKSRPRVAYPEAGAFVKFLVDTYGKEKLVEAYKSLRNSNDKAVHQQNQEKLERIYGKSLQTLREEWHRSFERPSQTRTERRGRM